MGVELAVRSDQPAFRGRHLAAAVDQAAFRADQRHRVSECADKIELQFQGCVGLACRQRGMHSAPHGAVEQGREPTAVHRGHRVVMAEAWLSLEYRETGLDAKQSEVERDGHRWRRDLAGEERLEYLQSAAPGDLVG